MEVLLHGHLLPLYVVYKSQHIWSSWCEGGPQNCRFNRTNSGWIDNVTFEDWFESVFLGEVRKKTGTKVLIGDNLLAHMSVRILNLCETHDIKFVFLPPNSTHMLQPLDVAYFGPLKRIWRRVLTNWKYGAGRNLPTIPENQLPPLLTLVMAELNEGDRGKRNLVSGFEKCGLYPVNRDVVLRSLPPEVRALEAVEAAINDSLVEFLRTMRFKSVKTVRQTRKKMIVVASRSVSIEDLQSPSTSQLNSSDDESMDDDLSTVSDLTESEESERSLEVSDANQNEPLDHSDATSKFSGVIPLDYSEYDSGDYVLVKFETDRLRTKHFVGQIDAQMLATEELHVKFLKRYRNERQCFVWPEIPENALVDGENVVGKLKSPIILRRGVLQFVDIDCEEWN